MKISVNPASRTRSSDTPISDIHGHYIPSLVLAPDTARSKGIFFLEVVEGQEFSCEEPKQRKEQDIVEQ